MELTAFKITFVTDHILKQATGNLNGSRQCLSFLLEWNELAVIQFKLVAESCRVCSSLLAHSPFQFHHDCMSIYSQCCQTEYMHVLDNPAGGGCVESQLNSRLS